MIAGSADLTDDTPRERSLTGMETWFAASATGVTRPPPRWKMWLLSICGIYPVITAVTVVFGPALAPLAVPLRFAVVTPVLGAAMTWVVMPVLSRVFGRFLYR